MQPWFFGAVAVKGRGSHATLCTFVWVLHAMVLHVLVANLKGYDVGRSSQHCFTQALAVAPVA